jgi:hypothetical protein
MRLDDQRQRKNARPDPGTVGPSCFSPTPQLSRGELSRHIKCMARARIPEFESSHASQPVRSLWDMSGRQKTQHIPETWPDERSLLGFIFCDFSTATGGFPSPVSSRQLSISVHECQRFGSNHLRPVRHRSRHGP